MPQDTGSDYNIVGVDMWAIAANTAEPEAVERFFTYLLTNGGDSYRDYLARDGGLSVTREPVTYEMGATMQMMLDRAQGLTDVIAVSVLPGDRAFPPGFPLSRLSRDMFFGRSAVDTASAFQTELEDLLRN